MCVKSGVVRVGETIVLENGSIRVHVNPGVGGKITSLFDLVNDCEWLIQKPAGCMVRPTEGGDFHRCCMFGWEEMFPTLLACVYPDAGAYRGKPLHDHGEIWFGNWELLNASDCIVQRYSCTTYTMAFIREIRFVGRRAVEMRYCVENRDRERLYFFWAPHPFFRVQEGDSIVFPTTVQRVINAFADDELGAAGHELDWRGMEIRGPAVKRRRKLWWAPGQGGSFAAIRNVKSGRGVRLSWDERENPFFACIVDEGCSHRESRVSFEPMNGRFDALEAAYGNGTARFVDPGQKKSWNLVVEMEG